MDDRVGPVVVDRANVEASARGEGGDEGIITRLITREKQSSVLLGLFSLAPGQRATFGLPHPNGMQEEIYYLLAGRLRVSWTGGEFIAETGQAILFPSGQTYYLETFGDGAVELVWTGYPAP